MLAYRKNVITDFTKERYLALVKSYPPLKEEKTQVYIMLILTFLALTFLGIFAINPTLTTITQLQRKLDDAKFADQSLKHKIDNLSSLNTQYESLADTWPVVDSVMPNEPKSVPLLGKIQALAKSSNVVLSDLQTNDVIIAKSGPKPKYQKEASFVFTATAQGTKENLYSFVKSIYLFDRIIAIESIIYTNDQKQNVTFRAKAFYLP